MRIPIKTGKEIRLMAEGGKKLARVLKRTLAVIKPGICLVDLDRLTEQLIEKEGGKPSFKMVPGYRWATCLNLNEGVVHGVPNNYRIQIGDLLKIDLGIFYQGYHTDMARTIIVDGHQATAYEEKKRFLLVGKKALGKASLAAYAGQRVGNISRAIEKEVTRGGCYPVQSLTGHGIGRKLHESPMIPCFIKGKIEETARLEKGMTLAIEVIYLQRKTDLYLETDGWSVKTVDGSWAGLFEDTILVSQLRPRILTE